MNPEEPDDRTLVAQVLAGDTDRFEVLVRRHQRLVFGIVSRRVGRQEADEVAQDVFVRAFSGLSRYEGVKPFANWLSIIAVRACCDHWRRHYRKREVPVSTLTDNCRQWMENRFAQDSDEDAERACEQKEASLILAAALDCLEPDDRMVLTLTHLEEKSTAEASELLGWSVAKVKVRAFRARAKMKKILQRLMEAR
ncbi:MAG: RNA polymerase sigma factor [Thermodesulfobacteriota bacterium]